MKDIAKKDLESNSVFEKNNSLAYIQENSSADYLYWRYQLLSLIDLSSLCKICDHGINEIELFLLLGISKEDFLKPNASVYGRVKQYIESTDKPKIF